MGTWGHGNLDSDYARDELSGRTSQLVDALMKRAARSESREADEHDYIALFVELEIVFALDKAKLLVGSSLPRPEVVDTLARDYIAGWDDNIDDMEPTPEHKRERRRIILDTFKRFAELCAMHDSKYKAPGKAKNPAKKPTKKKAAKKR